jgi:hypothetical protein
MMFAFSHIKQPIDGCGYGNENVIAVLVNHGSNNARDSICIMNANGQSVNENMVAQVVDCRRQFVLPVCSNVNATEFATYRHGCHGIPMLRI